MWICVREREREGDIGGEENDRQTGRIIQKWKGKDV